MQETTAESLAVGSGNFNAIRALFDKYVVPSYARFEIAFSHGQGVYLWDVNGKRYLDLGGGIAVCCLGHAHPELAETIAGHAHRLVHVSNLYYHELQGRLASELVRLIGPGKVFFCNSGAEANEGLFKLARRFGHDEGRFEILTTYNSFHGRTLAGISATGQEKVKKGFEPMVQGFRHVPFNDIDAMRNAISPATVAIMVEGIQGEGGVNPATAEYLFGLRKLCDEHNLLLLIDEVQSGHFRTGRFHSYQRILENCEHPSGIVVSKPTGLRYQENLGDTFLPDGVSMAKSLGNGFPIGAFWVRDKYAELLGPGKHATTYGGSPLACAVALKVLEIIQRDRLADNARALGALLKDELDKLVRKHPNVLKSVRGLGLMLGIELVEKDKNLAFTQTDKPASAQFAAMLHDAGLLTVPAGSQVIRLLPALNLQQKHVQEALDIIESVVRRLGA